MHVCVSPCVGEGMLGHHVLGENKGSEELTLENWNWRTEADSQFSGLSKRRGENPALGSVG